MSIDTAAILRDVGLTVVEWRTAATPPGRYPIRPLHTRVGIEVHHEGTQIRGPFDEYMRRIYADHRSDGRPDVFYGVVIDRGGDVAIGRGAEGLSLNSLGDWPTVKFRGNFEVEHPTEAAIAAFRLIRAAYIAHGCGPKLRGHGDRSATACPGRHLRAAFDQLLADPSTPPQEDDMPLTDDDVTRIAEAVARKVDAEQKDDFRKAIEVINDTNARNLRGVRDRILAAVGKVSAGDVDVDALAAALRDELGDAVADELAERLRA